MCDDCLENNPGMFQKETLTKALPLLRDILLWKCNTCLCWCVFLILLLQINSWILYRGNVWQTELKTTDRVFRAPILISGNNYNFPCRHRTLESLIPSQYYLDLLLNRMRLERKFCMSRTYRLPPTAHFTIRIRLEQLWQSPSLGIPPTISRTHLRVD